ncbi:MAG: hypothetical protein P8Z41_08390 [Anaerolineales bacterium]
MYFRRDAPVGRLWKVGCRPEDALLGVSTEESAMQRIAHQGVTQTRSEKSGSINKGVAMGKKKSSDKNFYHLLDRTSGPIAVTIGVMLFALLACNAPVQEQTTAAADTTAAETAEPTASNTPLPSATPTPDVDAMLSILDSYPSLETVRLRLDAMRIAPNQGGEPLTGRHWTTTPSLTRAPGSTWSAWRPDCTWKHTGWCPGRWVIIRGRRSKICSSRMIRTA